MTTPDPPWRPPAWARVAAVAVPVLAVLYAATLLPGVRGDGPVFVWWLEFGVGDGVIVATGLLCLTRSLLVRRARPAWLMLGASPLLYVLGDLVYYAFLQGSATPPYPSWADACWIGAYPLLAAGLVLLAGDGLHGARLTMWLDGLTGGLAAASLLGAVLLGPVLSSTGGPLAEVVTNLAYPVGDLALLVVLVLVFNLHGWRTGAVWWLLAWVVAALLVVDTAYLLQSASGSYVDGGLLDGGWSLAYAALAPAAWWCRPADPAEGRSTRAGLVVPAILAVLSALVLFAGAVRSLPPITAILALTAVLAATVRLMMALVETWRLVVARLEARTDELTGLPNRRRFLELVRASLDTPESTTVLIVDLDRFKQVNDSLGHGVGDTLLQVVSARLQQRVATLRTVVARLGGDEFAVVATGLDRAAGVAVAERVRSLVQEPVQLSGVSLSVDASVGIAFSPTHGSSWEELLSHADAAMYVAKRGRTGVEVFEPDRDETGGDRLRLLAELREALRDQTLEIHLQPVVSLADGSIGCAEALVRWRHPQRGLLAPAEFLPVAVEAGLSRGLTDEVLRMAAAQAAAWLRCGDAVPVTVNLFEADVLDPALGDRVAAACTAAGLPVELLQIEVTEAIAAGAVQTALPTLRRLREQGHRLLLDDFGTGYSALAVLRHLPLDVVKLDRSFLEDLGAPATDTIVRATVQMAHALGLEIVAEGVETAEALVAVRALGCDAAQGFFIQRPVPAAQLDPALGSEPLTVGHEPVG